MKQQKQMNNHIKSQINKIKVGNSYTKFQYVLIIIGITILEIVAMVDFTI